MKYFIVEDDKNIINILSRIILERKLGQVVGYALDGLSAPEMIKQAEPNIVLVDLFIPGKNGIKLVSELSKSNPEISFVMISQVSSKDMIAQAYESGIESYIQKPINAIEVESVLRRVNVYRESTEKLQQIGNFFNVQHGAIPNNEPPDYEEVIKSILQKIGIIGESGTQDIIEIAVFLVTSETNLSDHTIKEICNRFEINSKTVEQRIRRTATIGLVNLAHLGIEDYMNDTFLEYSNGLYNFSEVKCEMDCIRGKTAIHGKVSLRKFIDGLVFYCEKLE